jgi:hypothetical protein
MKVVRSGLVLSVNEQYFTAKWTKPRGDKQEILTLPLTALTCTELLVAGDTVRWEISISGEFSMKKVKE